MEPSERAPLWDSVTHPFANALEFAFGCHHAKLRGVFTIEGRNYKVCCDCGAKFDYSLRTMSIMPPGTFLTALRRLRARRRQDRRKLRQLSEHVPSETSPQP
jgi:hypothetical protein